MSATRGGGTRRFRNLFLIDSFIAAGAFPSFEIVSHKLGIDVLGNDVKFAR